MKTTGRKTVKGGRTSAPKTLTVPATDATAEPMATTMSATVPAARRPTHAQIAARSYELVLARGGSHGHDVEDWIQAERELGL
jgi:hypothetical protein